MPRRSGSADTTTVCLEIGKNRIFASAMDWPGWCRAGKSEQQALENLANYAPRYRAVADEAGIAFGSELGSDFMVAERLSGDATTDFGAPGAIAKLDASPVSRSQGARIATLVSAAWTVLDRVIAGAPSELRKGPRGGGRDRDKIADHVLGAEVAYARKLGIKHKQPLAADRAAIRALREDLAEAVGRTSDGAAFVERGWPQRYAARRIAWHVLDHAWEIQDRS